MLLRFLYLPLLLQSVDAQVMATYTPQPLEISRAIVGRKIPGIAVVSVAVCQPFQQQTVVDSRRVYSLSPFEMVHPDLVPVVLTRSVNKNWAAVTVRALAGVSSGGALLTVSGVIAASNPISTGLVAAGPILGMLSERLQTRIPDPSPFLNVLFKGAVTVPPGGCVEGLALARFQKGMRKESVEVK